MADLRSNIENVANKAAEASRNTADQAGRVAAEQAAQTTRTGETVLRTGAEAAKASVESGLDTAAQGFQRMTDQFSKVLGYSGPQSEELTRRSTANVQAVTEAATVLAKGAQEVSREWLGFAQDRHTKNMDGLKRLAGCRSVQDLMAVQSDILRDNLEQLIATHKRFAEVSVRVADEAAERFRAQVDGGRRAA